MIAKRMGRAADWEGETQEEWYDARCKRDLGISWADMVKRLSWQMPTPPPPAYNKYQISGTFGTYTRKAELYSTIFKKWGYPPLLTYAEPGYSAEYQPEMAKQYPLILSTGKRQAGWFHSEFRMVPWLREIVREPWLFITPKDAEPLGIKDGDWVWIESPVGKCMNKAVVTEGLLPGVVVNAQHAWWRPEKSAQEDLHGAFEWNIGCVIQDEFHDPECGGWPLKSQLCKVYKASPADIQKYKPEITLEQLKQLMPLKEV
jgi:anaerobic selenocysteine-containing dehydrogenase